METAWLIELKQSVSRTPTWYGEADEGVLGMTTDHMKAIRFCRKRDAEMVMRDIGWTEAFSCEHAWEQYTKENQPRLRRAPVPIDIVQEGLGRRDITKSPNAK